MQFYWLIVAFSELSSNLVNFRKKNYEFEGPEKATRGDEWKPIKIPQWNLVYIPKSNRRPPLLTQPRPHSYRKAISPQNQVRKRSGNTSRCWQECMRDWRQKSDQNLAHILTDISPNTSWALLKNHRMKATGTRKPRDFWTSSSRIRRGWVPATIHIHHEWKSNFQS
jgi:hypothetical protein